MSDVGLAELRGWPRGKEKLNPKGVEVGGLKNVKKQVSMNSTSTCSHVLDGVVMSLTKRIIYCAEN